MQRSVALVPLAAAMVFAGLALGGCANPATVQFLDKLTPYHVEIVQGNVVTKEQAAQVKPGMSRQQVREVLGSPLLTDIFHADRWDYVFTIKRAGTAPQERRVVAYFDGEKLKSIDASDLPSEQEFDASITRKSDQAKGPPPPLALTDEQRKALPAPHAAEAASAPAPVGPNRNYPPLEPR
jgi:outer membrane protein assembly factor BamE